MNIDTEDPRILKYLEFSLFDVNLSKELISILNAYKPNFKPLESFFAYDFKDNREDFARHIFYNNPLNEKYKIRAALKKDRVRKPYSETEGLDECIKSNCRSMNTFRERVQTRSGDEGMTTFVRCHDCGTRWVLK
jgi:DNA-directed RNA polymerase subunit M/transcription elongation factor TFIIS